MGANKCNFNNDKMSTSQVWHSGKIFRETNKKITV